MRYAQIRKTDIANGEGIRVSLYVQGCHRHCFNCFNQETWDFCGGEEFDVDIENTLIDLIKRPHISGLTVLGGEPLELKDRKLRFRGSSNQRIIDVPKSLENDKIVLYADSRFYK